MSRQAALREELAAAANPRASAEARALLTLLKGLSGERIFSGQHNLPGYGSHFTRRVKELTGHFPAIWGQDFGFEAEGQDGVGHRGRTLYEAGLQHAQGSIITLMWHAVRPMDGEPGTFKDSVQGKLGGAEWEELITEGSSLWRRWAAQADVVAAGLAVLRDKHIPVLWRPYHEMNGGWFWWGGRPGPRGYNALWRMLYKRFTKVHGLDNLLWVWNANAPKEGVDAYAPYYPGADCVDILAADVYDSDFKQSHHDTLLELAAGKPIALGEVGNLPAREVLEAQRRWVWFMAWNDMLETHNSPEAVKELYENPCVLRRGDLD